MALHVAEPLNYFLEVPRSEEEHLALLRHWEHLKVGFEGEHIWITGLSVAQANSACVRSLPYKTLYYGVGSKLFLINSLLPHRDVPPVLWTPIARALPVSLPAMNHHFFELNQVVECSLREGGEERPAFGLLVKLSCLGEWLHTAPAHRLANLVWVLYGKEKALVLGTPLLPLPGEVFWRMGDSLLPLGYEWEWKGLHQTIHRQVNEDEAHWILWHQTGAFARVEKSSFRPLTISSFRLSINTGAHGHVL